MPCSICILQALHSVVPACKPRVAQAVDQARSRPAGWRGSSRASGRTCRPCRSSRFRCACTTQAGDQPQQVLARRADSQGLQVARHVIAERGVDRLEVELQLARSGAAATDSAGFAACCAATSRASSSSSSRCGYSCVRHSAADGSVATIVVALPHRLGQHAPRCARRPCGPRRARPARSSACPTAAGPDGT